jgi:hypothetical protein
MTLLVKDKILFINPPSSEGRKLIRNFDCATESKGNYLYQPYDFLLLSSHITNKFELTLIDAISEKKTKKYCIEKIKKISPSIVIISLADSNWSEDLDFVTTTRSLIPSTKLIVFGDSFIDENSRKIITPLVDGILHNPIQINYQEILEVPKGQWINCAGFIKEDSYTKLDLKRPLEVSFPLPKHKTFLSTKYRWPFAQHFLYTTVFTSWGCPYSCSYCIMAKFPNYFRDSVEIYNELVHIKSLGLKEFYMGDRSFGLPRENVVKLLNTMISNKLQLKWSTYFHPNQYDKELFQLMINSGCHTVIIGIETANLKLLKKFGRHTKTNRLEDLLAHAKNAGIKVCGDFIIGLPGERKEDVLNTIDLAISSGIDFASFNIAAPLAGSEIRETAIKEGRLTPGELHFDSFGYERILGNGILSGKELLDLRNIAVRRFYFRIGFLIRAFFKIKTFPQLIIQLQEMIQLFVKTKKKI